MVSIELKKAARFIESQFKGMEWRFKKETLDKLKLEFLVAGGEIDLMKRACEIEPDSPKSPTEAEERKLKASQPVPTIKKVKTEK